MTRTVTNRNEPYPTVSAIRNANRIRIAPYRGAYGYGSCGKNKGSKHNL